MSAETTTLWWITLGIGVVVVLVVAVLLRLVIGSARRIRSVVEEIWIVGPMIANDTAHVDILRRINLTVKDLLPIAERLDGQVARIQEHAAGCAGCPRCVTGWR